jgi:hypothetical protein
MSEKSADTLEQVIKFAPKGRPSPYDTPVEEAGQAIVAKIQKAAELANEDYDRAMRVAHKPFNAAQSRRRSNKSVTGRKRTLPRPRDPR